MSENSFSPDAGVRRSPSCDRSSASASGSWVEEGGVGEGVGDLEERNKKIKILTVNIQGGIGSKLDDLLSLMKQYDVDIMCIQEIQLSESDNGVQQQVQQLKRKCAAHHVSLFVRLAPTTSSRHASVGFVVRWPWQTYITQLWSPDATGRSFWMKLHVGSLRLVICSAYAQATRKTKQEQRHFIKWHQLLRSEILRLQTQQWSIVVGGDFNQRLDEADNKCGQLRALVNGASLRDAFRILLPNKTADPGFTHQGWGKMTSGRIDYFLASADVQIAECLVDSSSTLSSDHYPLVMHMQCEEQVQHRSSSCDAARVLRRPLTGESENAAKKCEKYVEMLQDLSSVSSASTAMQMRSALISQMQAASEKAFGRSKPKHSEAATPPWRSNTRRAITCRRSLYRLRHAASILLLPATDASARAQILRERNKDLSLLLKHCSDVAGVRDFVTHYTAGNFQQALDALHQQHTIKLLLDKEKHLKAKDTSSAVEAALQRINNTFRSGKVGDIVRKALMQKKSGSPSVVLLHDNNTDEDQILADPAAVKQQYFAHYSALASVSVTCPCSDTAHLFDDEKWRSAAMDHFDPAWWDSVVADFISDEVQQAIKWTRNGSATGLDRISNEHYKQTPSSVADALTLLFNTILKEEQFPQEMLHNIVVPIPKKDQDSRVPANTRGISLMPCDMRIMCAILARRMSAMFAEHQVLDEAQFGFMRGRGTQGSLLVLRSALEDANQWHRPLCISSLDFAKAYDSVQPWLLRAALQRLRAPDKFVNLILSMFNGAVAQVRTAHGLTQPYAILRGTPQGNPLAPLLWNCCLDPLLCALRKQTQLGYKFGPAGSSLYVHARRPISSRPVVVNCLAYADDVRLLACSPSALQTMLLTCADFCMGAGLRLNVSKCEWMATRSVPLSAGLSVDKQQLQHLVDGKSMRILGVHFTPTLDFKPQMAKLLQCIKTLAQLMQLRRLTAAQAAYIARAVLAAKIGYVLIITGASSAQVQQLQSVVNKACLRSAKLPRNHARLLVTLPLEHMGCGVVELASYVDASFLRLLHRSLLDEHSVVGKVARERLRALQECWKTPSSPFMELTFGKQHCKRGDAWLLGHAAAVLKEHKLRFATPVQLLPQRRCEDDDFGPQLRFLLPHLNFSMLRELWELHGVCRLGAFCKHVGERVRLMLWPEVRRRWPIVLMDKPAPAWFKQFEANLLENSNSSSRLVKEDALLMQELEFADSWFAVLGGANTLEKVEGKLRDHLEALRVQAVIALLSSSASPLKHHGAQFQLVAKLATALGLELSVCLDKELVHSHDWHVVMRMATMQLPTFSWLARLDKQQQLDKRCRKCGMEEETLLHVIWKCSSHAVLRAQYVQNVQAMLHWNGIGASWSVTEQSALEDVFLKTDQVPLLCAMKMKNGKKEERVRMKKVNEMVKKNQEVLIAMWKQHVAREEEG